MIGGIERGSRAGRIAGWTRIEALARRFVLSSFSFSSSLVSRLKLSEPDFPLSFLPSLQRPRVTDPADIEEGEI